MQMRRFRAPSSKEALALVRRELGPDALIVDTRRLGGGLCEVVAVIDNEDSAAAAGGLTTSSPTVVGRIEDEMREIKELLLSISLKSGGGDESLTVLKRQMLNNGFGSALTFGLLAKACKTKGVKRDRGGSAEEMAQLREVVRGEISEKIRVLDPLKEGRVLSFIGPTGAGKTTTIAKLAAISVVKEKKKVALLTLDTLRIGAPEQLKTYGRIMGVAVGVAATTAELAAFLKIHVDKDLILIDTPGKNVRSSDYIRELQEMRAITPELRFNLVLSIRDRDESLQESVKGLSTLPVEAITFTKLDECSSFGQMLGVSTLAGKPISYLGTGQRVPGDLLAATKKEVLRYLMPA